jgi:integrase
MAREGTIFKKCDKALCKPETNKACGAGQCQHTCEKPERCPHKWTLRYWAGDRQRESSYPDKRNDRGQPVYGSGKKLAQEAQLKIAHDKLAQVEVFPDSKSGAERFEDAAEHWVSLLTGADSSKVKYRRLLKNHINPAMGSRTLRQVAADRDGVSTFLLVTMPSNKVGASEVKIAYVVIRAVVNDAVKAGKLTSSRLNGITLPTVQTKADFIFPPHGQLEVLADKFPEPYGLLVWLMRGCGLRIGEALAVKAESFNGGTLRITEQLLPNGTHGPLKHRKAGDYRDVPVPQYVSQILPADATGYLFPPVPRRTLTGWFTSAREAASIADGFTPHSLRHVFASVALSNGIPITDVSKWLGHQNINTTYSIYGHLVPSSWDKARAVLDAEHKKWVAA